MFMTVLKNDFDEKKASPERVYISVDEIEYWYHLCESMVNKIPSKYLIKKSDEEINWYQWVPCVTFNCHDQW